MSFSLLSPPHQPLRPKQQRLTFSWLYSPEAPGMTASSSRPIKRNYKPQKLNVRTYKLTFIKLLQKCLLRSILRLQKNASYMICLLPTIQRLLELLPPLQQQYINCVQICDISISFETLSYRMPYICWRYVQGVKDNNFRSLK